MLGIPTDDVLAYNENEVLSEKGLHTGVLRVVKHRTITGIILVDGRPGPMLQEKPHEIYTHAHAAGPVHETGRLVECRRSAIFEAWVCAVTQQRAHESARIILSTHNDEWQPRY